MKKILVITDSYNWATYHRGVNLKKYLPQYHFDIVAFMDIAKIDFGKYDVIYITNWPIYGYVKDKISKTRKYRLVTGVSSHIGRKSAKEMATFFSQFDKVGVSNMFLYREFLDAKLPAIYTPFGADNEIFKKESNLNNLRQVFGWVGTKTRPVKRFEQIKRCFDELGEGYQFKYIDQADNLSHQKLNNFYNSVGTVICFSESEGTPNPILEGAMCGRWIISTPVGNVPELVGGIKNFKTVSNISDLKKSIIWASQNRELESYGNMILKESMNNWTWKVRSKNFIKLFE